MESINENILKKIWNIFRSKKEDPEVKAKKIKEYQVDTTELIDILKNAQDNGLGVKVTPRQEYGNHLRYVKPHIIKCRITLANPAIMTGADTWDGLELSGSEFIDQCDQVWSRIDQVGIFKPHFLYYYSIDESGNYSWNHVKYDNLSEIENIDELFFYKFTFEAIDPEFSFSDKSLVYDTSVIDDIEEEEEDEEEEEEIENIDDDVDDDGPNNDNDMWIEDGHGNEIPVEEELPPAPYYDGNGGIEEELPDDEYIGERIKSFKGFNK